MGGVKNGLVKPAVLCLVTVHIFRYPDFVHDYQLPGAKIIAVCNPVNQKH